MKYAVVVPYAYKPYFDEFIQTLKIPRENCLFVNDTEPVGAIGIMKAHNMGIDSAKQLGADWLIVMSASIRFMEPGGMDFVEQLENISPDALVVHGSGYWHDEAKGLTERIALGWHLTAFKMDVFDAIGRWDENFTPYGFDDVDLTLRMKKYFGSQYNVQVVPVDMEHVSTSHSIQLAKVKAPSDPRILYFCQKWGRHPGAWQWDGWSHPFNDETKSIKYWPIAPNGSHWNE